MRQERDFELDRIQRVFHEEPQFGIAGQYQAPLEEEGVGVFFPPQQGEKIASGGTQRQARRDV